MSKGSPKRKGLFWVILIVFMILLGRAWQLQIIEGEKYRQLADKNRLRLEKVIPPRGRIFDRKGRLIVGNKPSFDLFVVPADLKGKESFAREVSSLLGLPEEEILKRINGARSPFEMVRLKKDLTFEELSRISANLWDFPALRILVTPTRVYPQGPVAPHLIGTVGEITQEELRRFRDKGYEVGDYIGKSGLEFQYEDLLKGKKGGRQVEVDALGRRIRILQEIEPQPGWDLYLNIDLDLQLKAQSLLEGKRGAIVAIDPRSGEILAMASSPSFDPRQFGRFVDPEKWRLLAEDPSHPLTNRAIQGVYAPGSVFKIIVALGALTMGQVEPHERFYCSGYFSLGNRIFRCWKEEGHGSVDLYKGIVQSCDVYFYQLGLRIGPKAMAEFARLFGLGDLTGVDLPGEKRGFLPYPQRGKWFGGDTVVMAIGQGRLAVTPLQLATFISAVANEGKLYRPFLVREAKAPSGRLIRFNPQLKGEIPLSQEVFQTLKTALEGVVEDPQGTGRAARLEGIKVAGKTGTAQVRGMPQRVKDPSLLPYEHRDHAWFVAYADADYPSIAVTVLIEHGGTGGGAAAPLARELIKYWLGVQP